jgi:hypothetical protein
LLGTQSIYAYHFCASLAQHVQELVLWAIGDGKMPQWVFLKVCIERMTREPPLGRMDYRQMAATEGSG